MKQLSAQCNLATVLSPLDSTNCTSSPNTSSKDNITTFENSRRLFYVLECKENILSLTLA